MDSSWAAVLLCAGLAACHGPREGAGEPAPLVLPAVAPPSSGALAALSEDVPPELEPSFVALAAAVGAGDDEVAERILARVAAVAPDGRTSELVQGYERILAGRALVRRLELELVCRRADVASPREGAPGARTWRVHLVARSREAEPVELLPGPGQLRIERSAVDPAGNEERSVELRPLEKLAVLSLRPNETVEVEIATLELGAPAGALVARTIYELELRSGIARVAGRELPAMRLHVSSAEALEHGGGAAGLPATSGELQALAQRPASTAREALELAVRLPRAERPACLDALAAEEGLLSEVVITKLVPALRFLAADPRPGGSPRAWRDWLRERAARRAAKAARPGLILPPAARP